MKNHTKKRFLLYLSIFLLILYGHNFLEPGSRRIHKTLPTDSLSNSNRNIEDILDTGEIDKADISILIEKSKYRLTVYYKGVPVKSYPAVFGFNPVDDKRMEGDGCTPEGVFKVKNLYPHHNWSFFILLNYPTETSRRKHVLSKRRNEIPSGSYIGGEIGIHGVPGNADHMVEERTNWTAGCISLKEDDIKELYSLCGKDTVVEILP